MSIPRTALIESKQNLAIAYIEVPGGTKQKYEFSQEAQRLKMARELKDAIPKIFSYGFIPNTRGGDGDRLDVVVYTNNQMMPDKLLLVRPVGVLYSEDEKGTDNKILSVDLRDAHFGAFSSINQIDKKVNDELVSYFQNAKAQDPKRFIKITGFGDADEAMQLIISSKRK